MPTSRPNDAVYSRTGDLFRGPQYHCFSSRGLEMKRLIAAASLSALFLTGSACAQSTTAAGRLPSPGSVVLIDSTGKVAARPLNHTLMLVAVKNGVVAAASIRSLYDADGHAASAFATWNAGGSVLFTSSDCTSGPHVYASQ